MQIIAAAIAYAMAICGSASAEQFNPETIVHMYGGADPLSVSFSSASKRIAIGKSDGKLLVLDADKFVPQLAVHAHDQAIYSATFFQNNKSIFTSSEDCRR